MLGRLSKSKKIHASLYQNHSFEVIECLLPTMGFHIIRLPKSFIVSCWAQWRLRNWVCAQKIFSGCKNHRHVSPFICKP